MEAISPRIAEKAEKDEYKLFGTPPADFDPKDQERKEVFAERLKELRKESGLKLKNVANEIGLTTMAISKYENGKMVSIPMQYLRRLSVFYQVSPHYLLGYVDEKDAYLCLREDGTFKKRADGSLRIFHHPMIFEPASYQSAVERYKNLYQEDTAYFYLIDRILSSGAEKKVFCKKILKEIDEFCGQ